MGPIDYSIDVKTPFESAMSGFAGGAAIKGVLDQRAQQAQAQQAQQAQQEYLQKLASNPNPTADDYAQATLAIPGMREQFKQAWDIKNESQQNAHLSDLSQIGYMIKAGQSESAASFLESKANSIESELGRETAQTQAMKVQANVIRQHPEFALGLVDAQLQANPKGKDVIANRNAALDGRIKEQNAPIERQKLQSDADQSAYKAVTAGAEAKYADQAQAEKIKTEQTKRQIDALNVRIAQANSETQRGQLMLERDKLNATLGKEQKAEQAAGQNQLDSTGAAIDNIDAILKHPALEPYLKIGGVGVGGGIGSVSGSIASLIPGSDAGDIRRLVDTVKSQQFLTQAQNLKGMGALSDAEGARLEKAVGSLDVSQSVGQFKTTLNVIKSTLEKARSKTIADGKIPTQQGGGAFVTKLPDGRVITENTINAILKSFPGATREQAMQYIKASGGQ